MDPSTRLDHVLFQLTPTRTRCDLVIFAGKSNEKLAYGLLEPFIAHLRSAKDQISKGGYSVTLRPPSASFAPWFTKATLQRFVRFVSTPEVLERFVTIEREISQLENSMKSYEAPNADGGLGTETEGNGTAVGANAKSSAASFKSKSDSDPGQEENSKARLQRVLETRKAVLRKEQAMVYARALAAGFEIDNLDDLLLFSDTFGASRLREACINFKELCKKKSEDRLWVDEIAAMQAFVQPELSYLGTSGIVLAGEENDPAMSGKQNGSTEMSLSDSLTDANQDNGSQTAQMPNPWANQFHPYLRNFQGPMYQQMPPYQGYVFPGMQGAPPYYPPNMQWPSNADYESHERRGHRSSRKKDKGSKLRGSENEDRDGSTESTGSSSESESDSSSERSRKKKHGKKPSRKVVIRNINYITSKRDGEEAGSSDEDEDLDGDSLKHQLEDAVGSFEKHQKSSSRHHKKRNGSKNLTSDDQDDKRNKGNENWDAFQQLLLKDEPETNGPESRSVHVEEEYLTTKRSEEQTSYSFNPGAEDRGKQRPVATDAFLVTDKGTGNDGYANFDPSESFRPPMKRGGTAEEFLFSQRTDEPNSYTRVALSDEAARSSVIKSQTSDDWFINGQSNGAANHGGNGDLRFTDGDYMTSSVEQVENKRKDVIIDDSLMIQGHLTNDLPERTNISLVSDFVEASFIENGTMEAPLKKTESQGFYEPVDLYMVRDRDTAVEQPVPSWSPEIDFENNVSVIKRQSDTVVGADSKLASNEKGQNNKKNGSPAAKASRDAKSRTVGGTLRRGKPDTTPGIRRSTFGSKTAPKSNAEKEEERRKRMEELLIQRQKRIAERSSLKAQKSKLQSPSEETKKPKPVLRTSTIERLAAAKTSPKVPTVQPKKAASKLNNGSQKTSGADSKKLKTSKSRDVKAGDENPNGVDSSFSDIKEVQDDDKIDVSMPPPEFPTHTFEEIDDSKDIKELHITSLVINKDVEIVEQTGALEENGGKPLEVHSTSLDFVKDNSDEISKESLPFEEEEKSSVARPENGPELSIHPLPESPTKILAPALIVEEKGATKGNIPVIPEVSEIEESTPPLTTETIVDPMQSRKKWDSAENSPKAKGFRKLLMFGRKS